MVGSAPDGMGQSGSPKAQIEEEKRMRRVIANSNERRRMQSINNGFSSLRNLLPHQEGEKLSKVSLSLKLLKTEHICVVRARFGGTVGMVGCCVSYAVEGYFVAHM